MFGEGGAPQSYFWDEKLHDYQARPFCEYYITLDSIIDLKAKKIEKSVAFAK